MEPSHQFAPLPPRGRQPAAAREGPRIACILDPWTFQILRPEAVLLPLTRGNWRQVLTYGAADMVLVSAAWESADGGLQNILLDGAAGNPLRDLLGVARQRGIPSVFWDTDDPFHAPLFAAAVEHFDHVFAVSRSSLHHYGRGEHLPAAIQPRLAHPFRESAPAPGTPLAIMDGWADLLHAPDAYEVLLSLRPDEIHVLETRYEIYAVKLSDTDTPTLKEYVKGLADRPRMLTALRYGPAFLMFQRTLATPVGQELAAMEALACGARVLYRGRPPTDLLPAEHMQTCADDAELIDAIRAPAEWSKRLRPWRELTLRHSVADRLARICAVVGIAGPKRRTVSLINAGLHVHALTDLGVDAAAIARGEVATTDADDVMLAVEPVGPEVAAAMVAARRVDIAPVVACVADANGEVRSVMPGSEARSLVGQELLAVLAPVEMVRAAGGDPRRTLASAGMCAVLSVPYA